MEKVKKPIFKLKKLTTISKATVFELSFKNKNKIIKNIKNINVKLLGKHNVLNHTACISSMLKSWCKLKIS